MNDSEMVQKGLEHIRGQVDNFAAGQKARLGEVSEKTVELQARLLELEQRSARRGGGGGDLSAGSFDSGRLRAILEGSEGVKAMADRKIRRTVLEMPPGYFDVKAQILSTGIAMPDQRTDIAGPAQRRMTIRALIPSVPTDGGSIQYLQETGSTNAAATVSEGDAKPESSFTFQLKTAAVVTIAHWIRISAQALSDIPQMERYIDGRLRYGLAYVEESQLLKGSGAGNNLNGLYTAATAYSAPFSVPSPSKIDQIRLMIAQLENADFTCTGIVLHPYDWAAMQLKKDTQGRYIFGDPKGSNMPSMWGIPVIPTTAMTIDTAMVGDFEQAALLFDRMDARVDISTETDDDFTTNRAHVRAEERLALAILRPTALIKNADLSGS